jgi:hypothetical protein
MARDGNGTMIPVTNTWNVPVNGVLATGTDFKALYDDLIAALTQSVSRDGQTPMTGNLNMGNNKINGVSAGTGLGQALAFEQLFSQGGMADIASAATTDIGAQNTNFLRVTGNTTITSFGTNFKGPRFLVFEGAVTLTHSSTLVLPGGANITTAAGDVLIAIPGATLGTADKWVVVSYQKANTVPGYANIPGGFGFRNRIINGDMRIDQRTAGASVTATVLATLTYVLDRWGYLVSSVARMSIQQNAGAVTPPVGFTNYLGVTSLGAYMLGSGEQFSLEQNIEGFNVADLGWGTANAQAVTLSFWVRSSLTGTFSVVLKNSAANRSYPAAYTINSANTWEQKTITVPGDTAGTWVTNNGLGIRLYISVGSGSSLNGTSGAWSGSDFYAATGQVSVVGTSGATFYITGVQLEAGSVASPFERRDYGRELIMCQRYYEIVDAYCVFPTAAGGIASSSTFVVQKRSAPSVTRLSDFISAGEAGTIINGASIYSFAYGKSTSSSVIGGRFAAQIEL